MHLEEMKREIGNLVVEKGFYNEPEDVPKKLLFAFIELGEASDNWKKGRSEEEIAEELIDVIFYVLDASRLACPSVNMDETFQKKLKKNKARPFQYGEGHRHHESKSEYNRGLDMKKEDLYSEIVKQLEERADVEVASKRIAKAKYFGIIIKSYGLKEAQGKELIESYLGDFRKMSLNVRLQLVKMFARALGGFNAVGLEYMFTGALAVSYYGRARTTVDVDVVVAVVDKGWRTKLVSVLERAELVVDEERVDAALRSGYRIVTFEDSKSPLTVDVILSDVKLVRRAGSILGLATFYQTPEDLILAKLRMIKATVARERALKDEGDVKAILKFTRVDMDLLERRARESNTLSILEGIIADKPS